MEPYARSSGLISSKERKRRGGAMLSSPLFRHIMRLPSSISYLKVLSSFYVLNFAFLSILMFALRAHHNLSASSGRVPLVQWRWTRGIFFSPGFSFATRRGAERKG